MRPVLVLLYTFSTYVYEARPIVHTVYEARPITYSTYVYEARPIVHTVHLYMRLGLLHTLHI